MSEARLMLEVRYRWYWPALYAGGYAAAWLGLADPERIAQWVVSNTTVIRPVIDG